MAVNQVSLFLYPPRWKQQVSIPNPTAVTNLGTPVRVMSHERVPDVRAPVVAAMEIQQWLVQRGFVPVKWCDRTYERGSVQSLFGAEKEIEVSVWDENGELASLYVRFTLEPGCPPPLKEWAALVREVCECFELRLGGDTVAPCGAAEFMAAVTGSHNYREFAASSRWSQDAEPGVGADSR